jgi:predicted RNA-binding protein with PIN domain
VRYLIDGYNLAHALGTVEGKLSPAGLARGRLALLKHLAAAHGDGAAEVTVVFDAPNAKRLDPEQSVVGIDVRNAVGGTADDLIEDLVRGHSAPKRLTVVSDDRRVQAAGRHRGCTVLGCQAYLDLLDRLGGPPPATPDPQPEKPDRPAPGEVEEWERRFGLPGRRQRPN